MTLALKELKRLEREVRHVDKFLGNVDYRTVRRELETIRIAYVGIRNLSDDPPPVRPKGGGVNGLPAVQRLILSVEEWGLLNGIRRHDSDISSHLSEELLPRMDADILQDEERLHEMLEAARGDGEDDAKIDGIGIDDSNIPDSSRVAERLVVDMSDTPNWKNRPRVDRTVQARRIRIGAAMTKLFGGSMFVGANVALGALSTIVLTVPAITGNVPTVLGIVSSVHVGMKSVSNGLMDLANALESE